MAFSFDLQTQPTHNIRICHSGHIQKKNLVKLYSRSSTIPSIYVPSKSAAQYRLLAYVDTSRYLYNVPRGIPVEIKTVRYRAFCEFLDRILCRTK